MGTIHDKIQNKLEDVCNVWKFQCPRGVGQPVKGVYAKTLSIPGKGH